MATAHKVINALEADGLAETKVGVGTIVAEQPTISGVGPPDVSSRVRHEGRIRLASERSTGTSAQRRPSERVAAALGGTRQSDFIWRRPVIYRDEQPYSVAISWFLPAIIGQRDPSILEALMSDQPIPHSAPQFVVEQLGRQLTEGTDRVCAIAANEEVARDLGIPVGSPVLYVAGTLVSEDWPIEVEEYFYPAESAVTYRYNM